MSAFNEFLNSAVAQMEINYPSWREKDRRTPICIPPALDVNTFFLGPRDGVVECICFYCHEYLRDDYKESSLAQKNKTMIAGNDAEMLVFNAVQSATTLGGILIANIDNNTFKNHSALKRDLKKFCKIPFEIDFIFLHREIGILVIEAKATKWLHQTKNNTDSNNSNDPYGKAKNALPNYVGKIKELYEILTNETCNVPVIGVICLPNVSMSEMQETNGIWHFDKNTFADFENALQEKMQSTQNYYDYPNFDKFVACLATYRDLVFLQEGENALKINQIISNQEFMQKNNKTVKPVMLSDGCKKTPIFLTARQKECLASENKRKIICGFPGTGKTILIMLHIQDAARERHRTGRIIVNVGSKRLMRKYAHSVLCGTPYTAKVALKNVEDEDHFFADEVPEVFGEWEDFLARRSKLENVFTVIAISGRTVADNISEISQDIERNDKLNNFSKFNFKIIFRGTRNIIHYWADKCLTFEKTLSTEHWSPKERKKVPDKVQIGHNVHGANVEEEEVATTRELLSQILAHVQKFLGTNRSSLSQGKENTFKFRECHIAVLATNDRAMHFICQYLKTNGFKTEPLAGQCESAIKVDKCHNVLSQQSPVVIMVNYYGYDYPAQAMELTLASRAIAYLIVLERNRMLIQRKVDEILHNYHLKITCEIIQRAVRAAGKELNETAGEPSGESALNLDEFLANLRYNVTPESIKNIARQLSECENFSDALCELTRNDKLLYKLVSLKQFCNDTFRSYHFTQVRLKNRDRIMRLKFLDFKDKSVLTALLSFYEVWAKLMEQFLTEGKEFDRTYPDYDGYVNWIPIIRILMTMG